MAVLVYVLVVLLSMVALLVVINPSGPVHSVFTVTGTSTALLNSTVQVRITLVPIGQIGLTGLLLTFTEIGTGTVISTKNESKYNYRFILYSNLHCKTTSIVLLYIAEPTVTVQVYRPESDKLRFLMERVVPVVTSSTSSLIHL